MPALPGSSPPESALRAEQVGDGDHYREKYSRLRENWKGRQMDAYEFEKVYPAPRTSISLALAPRAVQYRLKHRADNRYTVAKRRQQSSVSGRLLQRAEPFAVFKSKYYLRLILVRCHQQHGSQSPSRAVGIEAYFLARRCHKYVPTRGLWHIAILLFEISLNEVLVPYRCKTR